jgi:death-on-curing protein
VTYYPGIEDVISAHSRLIARFGGTLGIRDRAALESALARPQTGYYEDLIQEATALWESLSQNHPFLDGNKRTAITAVTAAFLSVNGCRLDFDDAAAFQFMIELYESGTFRFAKLETWLRQHSRSARSPGR